MDDKQLTEILHACNAEIGNLRAENAKLREALETIATPSVEYDNNTLQAIRHIAKMVSIAKTALGGK